MQIREQKDWEKIYNKTDARLTHEHNFIFLFQGNDKLYLPIICFVEDKRTDKTDDLFLSAVENNSRYLLKGIFSHYNAVSMFKVIISPTSFLYNKDFPVKNNGLCFYFKQSPDTRECVAVNPYTLISSFINE